MWLQVMQQLPLLRRPFQWRQVRSSRGHATVLLEQKLLTRRVAAGRTLQGVEVEQGRSKGGLARIRDSAKPELLQARRLSMAHAALPHRLFSHALQHLLVALPPCALRSCSPVLIESFDIVHTTMLCIAG